MLRRIRHILLSATATAMLFAGYASADDDVALAPYKMVRSLQAVQDSVVLGDHSAIEMQRFMLGSIDERLRASDPSVFNDPRNIDAALIYAMSGGNPATLSFLVSRDIEGNFDTRVTDALSHYLNGKGALMVEQLQKALPEYKNSRIGPYLYLVLGNAASMQDPKDSLSYYDWARLTSPGTNIEEAALRRSLALSLQLVMPEKAFRYALTYARRFMTSPYASQFADLFVELAVTNYSAVRQPQIEDILSLMDRPRRREVYLRIARRAAIAGMQELTTLASQRAAALSDVNDAEPKALADLYSGLVGVPSTGIVEAVKTMSAIPDGDLTPRDLALRQAAQAVAEEVLRAPVPESPTSESLTQDTASKITSEIMNMNSAESGSGDSPFAAPATDAAVTTAEGDAARQTADPATTPLDPAFQAFMSAGRSKLDEIDALLKGTK